MNTDWRRDALCAQVIWPDGFFPERGGSPRAEKAICLRCPVTAECLDFALSLSDNPAGVWGATTERQRERMRRKAS